MLINRMRYKKNVVSLHRQKELFTGWREKAERWQSPEAPLNNIYYERT